jgi:PhnB protein
MPVKPIPDGYAGLIPSLVVDGAADAIEFYKRAFGATERMRMPMPDGGVAHAELLIGDAVFMIADPFPESTLKPPKELGGTPMGVFLYVEDVDATVQQAVDAGATVTMPVEDQFWGDRYGKVTDPFGHEWEIATHVEDVSPEEMEERAKAAMASMN